LVEILILSTGVMPMTTRRKRTLVIRDPEKVRALRTPLRQKMLETLIRMGEGSVKDVAREMDRAPGALYYHVHELTDAGLIREVGKRSTGRRPEAVYAPAAKRITLDRTGRAKAFVEALADLQRSTLRAAEREAARALDASRDRDEAPAESVSLLRISARLKPGAAAQARKLLRETVRYIEENDDAGAAGTFALTATFVRLDPPHRDE
jgi:transposase-like protein